MQTEDRVSPARPLVDVVDPEPVDLDVVRGERVPGKTREAVIRGAEALDHRGALPGAHRRVAKRPQRPVSPRDLP